ncbi:MAG: sensor histidine kinase [Ruminococcus sp.]|jgi:signal transduction histidine kinase
MDWEIIIICCAIVAAGMMGWKIRRMQRDVYEFADAMEQNLDAVLQGRKPEEAGETWDTLLGKLNEKLCRVYHVLEKKEEENLRGRRQMKELISDISHQTKTPVANQKICLEILKNMALPDEANGFLVKMEHQTDRLDFLFQSLVKMSRLETDIIQIRKKNTDLMQTLSSAVSAVVPAAAKKGIVLDAAQEGMEKVPPEERQMESILLPHDRKWTEEAVFNLLDNAVKYTPNGGRIRIQVLRREIFTEIHVKDTGKGIPLERQAQIFTRFYREPEVHNQEGLGIGLYLTRKIVEMQGGYVEVRSEAGRGSDFCICLPNVLMDRQRAV